MTTDDTLYYALCREAEREAGWRFFLNCLRVLTFRRITQTSAERRNEAFYEAWRRENDAW